MDAKERTLVSYEGLDGHAAFDEWIDGLSQGLAAIIVARLERVEQGLFGDCAPVGHGVFEFKIDTGSGYRVYFGNFDDVVVLLNGGDKGTQNADIRKSHQLWQEFKVRNEND